MNDKIIYLRQWLSKTIAEYPDVIDPSNPKQTPEEIYATLFTYWSKDIQEAMKSLLLEVMKK
jgi:hypothetical protein